MQLEHALEIGEQLRSQDLLERANVNYMAAAAGVAVAGSKQSKGDIRAAKKIGREYQQFVRKLQAMAQGTIGVDVDEQGRPIATLEEAREWMIQIGVMAAG